MGCAEEHNSATGANNRNNQIAQDIGMNAQTPETVSVILTYYNRADTLSDAARSVLEQTHRELTLYLVDDASTDDSRRVAGKLDDSRIVHVDLPRNLGVAKARNVGIESAHTTLVAFMDSDDIWLPRKLEIQLRCLRDAQMADSNVAVVGCGWQIHDAGLKPKEFSFGPYSRIDILHDRVAGLRTPMLIVDRSVAARDARFDESLPALLDRDYVMSCLANDTSVVIVPRVLSLVRRGRADHVASSRRVAMAFEMLTSKYATELARFPELKTWYSFRAAREHLIHRDVRQALGHAPMALGDERAKRSVHLVLGFLGGRKGLAMAQKICQLS
jgi:glycosyltransferase involved in cell wall biosynthesis